MIKNALEKFDEVKELLHGNTLAVFLDYDGTLTPIVSHPSEAKLSQAMRQTLEKLAARHPVAIISGRDRKDVESFVKLENLFYAGSHGFDIAGPHGQHFEHEEGTKRLPDLNTAANELEKEIPKIQGAWVERKKYAIAIHYRQAAAGMESTVEAIVKKVHANHAKALRITAGKKIFELQPAIPWDKGKAVHYLLKLLKLDKANVLPIYIGDDVTDEDAFKALIGRGLGIAVQDSPQPTAALYTLKDPEEVRVFLSKIATPAGKKSTA